MKLKIAGCQAALAAAVMATLTLASGCASNKGGTGTDYDAASETGSSSSGQTKAVIPLYKESAEVGTREVDAGTVRVKKVVKTETVNQPVVLRHEEIEIQRLPASASDNAPADYAFNGQDTVIHLTKEEPVVQKRTTSAGQLVVQSHSQSSQTSVQTQLRREEPSVEKSGEVGDVTITQGAGPSMGSAESPSGQSSGGSTVNPAVYSSGDATGMQGTAVEYSNRKVLSVMGDQLTCIDAGDGHPMYIYSKYGASRLKPGDYISVTGVIKTSAADTKGPTKQFLDSQHAYVWAKTIDRANP